MKLLLVGCGRMGTAMLTGWLSNDAITHVDVVDRHVDDLSPDPRVSPFAKLDDWIGQGRSVDVVILAVKPAYFEEPCRQLKSALPDDLPILSVAAGITLTRLASLVGETHPLIRTMPNTPSSVGQGVTGACFNNKIKQNHMDIADSLLSSLGTVVQLADESQMDALTAISGCGPAYFYYLTELIEKSAQKLGLPPEIATVLARETFMGSAALMRQTGQSPEELRLAVAGPTPTSATGTAILRFQENQGLEKLVDAAISAACERAKTLGKTQ